MSNMDMISSTINVKHGHDLINFFAKRETNTSLTVIKAESIPTNVYLDIYVRG